MRGITQSGEEFGTLYMGFLGRAVHSLNTQVFVLFVNHQAGHSGAGKCIDWHVLYPSLSSTYGTSIYRGSSHFEQI